MNSHGRTVWLNESKSTRTLTLKVMRVGFGGAIKEKRGVSEEAFNSPALKK